MKRILTHIILLSLSITYQASSMDRENSVRTNATKHILVPLEGFLFQVDSGAALGEMGATGTMSSLWTSGLRGSFSNLCGAVMGKGPDQTVLATRLFTLINEMEYQPQATEDCPEVYWQNLKMPHVVVHGYLQGNKKCTELLAQVLSHLGTKAGRAERASLESSVKLMLDPDKNARTLKPNAEAVVLLKQLRLEGHTLHVVDNWNGEAFDCLREKHRVSLEDINGKMFVSGHERKIKAANCTALHDCFFDKNSDINREQCVVIETEAKHLPVLQKKTFTPLFCQNGNIKELRDKLQSIGLLKN